MSKVTDWTPEHVSEEDYYSKELIIEIVDSVGKNKCQIPLKSIKKKLNNLAEFYFMRKLWQEKPSPSQQRKQYELINKASIRLLKSLGLTDNQSDSSQLPYLLKSGLKSQANIYAENNEEYPEFPSTEFLVDELEYKDYMGDQALESAIIGIKRLAKWSENASQKQQQVIYNKSAEATHKGNEALNSLILELASLYEEAFNKPPGLSRPASGGEYSGPWPRFLQKCLIPLNEKYSIPALSERWKNISSKNKGKEDSNSSVFPE